MTFSKRSNLRTYTRPKAVKSLDNRGIRLTSVDLTRFRWDEPNMNGGIETVTSPVTI